MAPPGTPSIDTLTAFLAARLDEAEAHARACTPGPWRYDPTKCWLPPHPCGPTPWAPNGEETVSAGASGPDAKTVCTTGPADDPQSMADAAHIAAHDPAWVLADITAKRTLITMVAEWRHHSNEEDPWYACPAATDEDGEYVCIPPGRRGGDCDCGRDWRAQQVLSVLAAGFSAHPDYDLACARDPDVGVWICAHPDGPCPCAERPTCICRTCSRRRWPTTG